MVASQLRKFSVYLENGISYTLGASNKKHIKPQAFLYRYSFIGLLTNGVFRIDERIWRVPRFSVLRRVGMGQNTLSKKRSWVEMGTFTRMRCEIPLEDSFHRKRAFRTRDCLPAPACEGPELGCVGVGCVEMGWGPSLQVFPLSSVHISCMKPLSKAPRWVHRPGRKGAWLHSEAGSTHILEGPWAWTRSRDPSYSECGLQGAGLQLSRSSQLHLSVLVFADGVFPKEGKSAASGHMEEQ